MVAGLTAQVTIAGEELELCPERAVYWQRKKILLVADPHFGKAASFRALGVYVPKGTTGSALARLDALIARVSPERIVFLGDFLHAREGRNAETFDAIAAWRRAHAAIEMQLVRGNHDRRAGDPPPEMGLSVVDGPLREAPFALAHHPVSVVGGYVLAGHVHPCALLRGNARQRERLPCFWFGREVGVLPAFGAFTGTAEIDASDGDQVWVVVEGPSMEVVRVSGRRRIDFLALEGSAVSILLEHANCARMTDLGAPPLAEDQLHALLAATLVSLPDFVAIGDPDGRVVFINPAGRRLIGLAPDADVSAMQDAAFHPPEALFVLRTTAQTIVLREGHWHGETILRTLAGEDIPVSIAIVAEHGTPGQPVYLASVMRDLRGRVRAEEALRDSEARAHFLADAVPTQVWTADTRGSITWANQCACSYLGLGANEVRATQWTDIAHPDDWAHARSGWAASRESGAAFHAEVRLRRADGVFRWHTVRASPMRDEAGAILQWYGTSADIDDARSTRDALERESAFLAAVLENLADGVVACDAQGRLTIFNRATREFHGLPESRIPSEEWSEHYALYRPDGRTPLDRSEVPLFRALKGEEVRDAEMVIAPRELPARTLRASGRPLRAADGTITGAVVVMRDVTNMRRLEEQLRQAQKMEAVGQLAGGVAHDFNNLLTAISFSVEFLRAELPPEDALRADVDQIGEAAERAAALTSQLLAFGRRQMLQPRPVNLNDSVASVMRMLPRLIRADIKLGSSSDSRAAWTVVDPGQVEQVIVNLILNARDALPDGGEILVATHVVALTADVLHPHGVIRTGEYAVVSVSDNGSGMDDATLTRLFEPFFTTKERGKGTGLGLATVHGIVEQSGGSVVVSSMQTKGTTFAVYFPLHSQGDAASIAVDAAPGTSDALPAILLVDDEALVLQLGERMLSRAGYSVVTAADGETALELLADGRVRSPFLLVTDVAMPGMSGRALADTVREQYNPDGTVFISGFIADQQLNDGLPDASRRLLLPKPFSAAQLLEAVQRASGAR